MEWQVIDTGVASADFNMAQDDYLLNQLSSATTPVLHFYGWEGDCATYGHFIKPFEYLSAAGVQKHHLNLAKRPTGGGIIFHLCDFAFSMFVPAGHYGYSINTLDNYAFINSIVANVIEKFRGCRESPILFPTEKASSNPLIDQFCMANPTKYDVMLERRKVGGGAQRRTRHGFLHQGTISLAMPSQEYLKDVLRSDMQVIDAMKQNSYLLLGDLWTPSHLLEARRELQFLLVNEARLFPENGTPSQL